MWHVCLYYQSITRYSLASLLLYLKVATSDINGGWWKMPMQPMATPWRTSLYKLLMAVGKNSTTPGQIGGAMASI